MRALRLTLLLAAFLIFGAPSPAPAPPDLLLITIDTLRGDALGVAGKTNVQTPALDRLARAGRYFPNAHAHNVITLPSHTNLLTGLYPYQHGVRENSGFRLREDVPTLATVLKAAGYSTAAFVSAFPLDSRFGLGRGFDVYDDRFPRGSKPTEFVLAERRGDETVRLARAWWEAAKGKKRFLWIHLFDPHAPYLPPEPYATRFRDAPYLGEISAVDSYLAPLLEPFLAGKEAPALIAVTADHGESLGDHGELTHGLFAYESTLHVPLLLWGAGVPAGSDARSARHVDVFPTFLAAAKVAPPSTSMPGRSLLGAAPSGNAADSYFESLSANLNRGWAPLAGLIREGKKVIRLPLPELYDLPSDPAEARNLNDREKALARTLLEAMPREAKWPPEREDLSPEVARQLAALGYVAGSAKVKESYGPEDDPKRLIDLDRKIHQIVDLYSRGEVAKAVALGREIVAARPEMGIGYSLLSQALLEQGSLEEAIRIMDTARRKDIATESLLRQLGLSLAEAGKAPAAVELMRTVSASGDPDSVTAYGLVLSEAGRQDEARTVLEAHLASEPESTAALEGLGLIALRQGDWVRARQRSQEAVALNATLPRAWNNLGVALYQLKQIGPALDAWQKAVALDPKLWDALFNLGLKAAEHGRPEVAKKALAQFIAGAPARYAQDVPAARALLARLGGG